MTRITTAMLLAAGLGTRMKPLTDTLPQAADRGQRPHAGRPRAGQADTAGRRTRHRQRPPFRRPDGSPPEEAEGHRDHHLDERNLLLETGGGIIKALPLLGDEPFYAINTDVTWATIGDTTFHRMAKFWNPDNMDALLLLADMTQTLGFRGPGDFYLLPDGQVQRRGDRPTAPYVFAGTHITTAEKLRAQNLKAEPFSANVYWNAFNKTGRLHGTIMTPFWMHVGDPAGREEAEARLQSMKEKPWGALT